MEMDKCMKEFGIFADKTATQNKNYTYPSHTHDYHELYFLVSGKRRYFIGHKIYDVSPKNLVFIPRFETHKTTSLNMSGYDRYVLFVYEKSLRGFIELLGKEEFNRLMNCGCLKLPQNAARQIENDLEILCNECRAVSPYSYVYLNHLVQDILLCALRYGNEKSTSFVESADKIQDISKFIQENYDTQITLDSAAKAVYMERTYFSKRFKQLTGFGFQEFLTQTRISAARRMLKDTNLSIIEIAGRCGFSSSNYFGDVFRRLNGVSPSEFRKGKHISKDE